MDVLKKLRAVKNNNKILQSYPLTIRNNLLKTLAKKIRQSSSLIIKENAKDLKLMDPNDPKFDRLLLNKERIDNIAEELENVANLNFTDNKILEDKTLANGLNITKTAVPLGLVAVIYESRPNVTLDVFALCFKTANCCILKGGSEAEFSNKILVNLIKETLEEKSLTRDCIYLMPPERAALSTLLESQDLIDVCIPRGSAQLIDYVRKHAKIPIIETGAGVVHVYFDKDGDKTKAKNIVYNAKTRRVSVCNALDTFLIHKDRLKDLAYITHELSQKDVVIYADPKSFKSLLQNYPKDLLKKATSAHYGYEFLSYSLAIKTVKDFNEALKHIEKYSSKHSDVIISENEITINSFLREVDSAVVYANASPSFTDGAQFGLGAEIGISTQKLHARGPMGLEALQSYKWVIRGNGQVRY